jgi:hypothetical protein
MFSQPRLYFSGCIRTTSKGYWNNSNYIYTENSRGNKAEEHGLEAHALPYPVTSDRTHYGYDPVCECTAQLFCYCTKRIKWTHKGEDVSVRWYFPFPNRSTDFDEVGYLQFTLKLHQENLILICIEELYLLRHNAVQSIECQLIFRRNISLPSSGS